MKTQTQTHKYSCWPCCICIALEYFDIEHICTENKLIKECGVNSFKWTSPKTLYNVISNNFPSDWSFEITLYEYGNLETFMKEDTIHSVDICLTMYEREKNPLWADHLEKNKFGMHYIFVLHDGRDAQTNNPFWFEENIPIERLRDRMSLHRDYLIWKEKLLIRLWIIKPFTWVRIKRSPTSV